MGYEIYDALQFALLNSRFVSHLRTSDWWSCLISVDWLLFHATPTSLGNTLNLNNTSIPLKNNDLIVIYK